jgi:hypothetical protein
VHANRAGAGAAHPEQLEKQIADDQIGEDAVGLHESCRRRPGTHAKFDPYVVGAVPPRLRPDVAPYPHLPGGGADWFSWSQADHSFSIGRGSSLVPRAVIAILHIQAATAACAA